jgi:hypothetical protein
MFKTLSDIKKAAKKDVKIKTVWPYDDFWKCSLERKRTIVAVQSNGIKFDDDSWLIWPRAAEVKIFSDGFELINGAKYIFL